ncbi:MAG: DUF5411 family protein [Bacilli bacterium]|nr:DUF5411 family protein [Bacilli bacterium]
MKESFWGIFVVALGIIGIAVVNSFQTITTTNEQNYYLLKEVTEASMFDAVDLGYYRTYGEIKIMKEKFVENFTRRFAESFGRTKTYNIIFYDIIEKPPKVSIGLNVGQNIKLYNYNAVDFDIINNIDGILETNYD